MKNERTLAYQMATKIHVSDIEEIAAAGEITQQWTANATYNSAGWDGALDATWDC